MLRCLGNLRGAGGEVWDEINLEKKARQEELPVI